MSIEMWLNARFFVLIVWQLHFRSCIWLEGRYIAAGIFRVQSVLDIKSNRRNVNKTWIQEAKRGRMLLTYQDVETSKINIWNLSCTLSDKDCPSWMSPFPISPSTPYQLIASTTWSSGNRVSLNIDLNCSKYMSPNDPKVTWNLFKRKQRSILNYKDHQLLGRSQYKGLCCLFANDNYLVCCVKSTDGSYLSKVL